MPLPPLPEQHRIVAEVERRLSVVAELEATVAANLARAGRLRQAVLKRAFEGRLVAQDAGDEPAEVLPEQRGKGRRLMNLNDLLRSKNIDPRQVIVLRHRPKEQKLNKWLPWLAAEKPDVFNAYQQTQGEKLQKVMQS